MNSSVAYRLGGRVSIVILLLLGAGPLSFAQVEPENGAEIDVTEYTRQVRQMVSFLEFTLNTLGNPETTERERGIIINESYSKIFRDDKVQIEDDLIEGRSTATNKDVRSYLKDITFFYRQVTFTFENVDVVSGMGEHGGLYFKVSMDRLLEGIMREGDTVQSRKPRYIEINLDPETNMLMIVSMYTVRLSEKEELKNWWNALSHDWKKLFAPYIQVNENLSMSEVLLLNQNAAIGDTVWIRKAIETLSVQEGDVEIHPDSVSLATYRMVGTPLNSDGIYEGLKQIAGKKRLDLTSMDALRDLEPLAIMTGLRELDVSGLPVKDLFPLRNLIRLEILNLSGTQVSDLSPLRYAGKLRELNCSNTPITDLRPLAAMPQLQTLKLDSSSVSNLTGLEGMSSLQNLSLASTGILRLDVLAEIPNLKNLDISRTVVSDLSPLAELDKLEVLNIEDTPVEDISALRTTVALRYLYGDRSGIRSLEPLMALPVLSKVYCDDTPVGREEAKLFMENMDSTLVVVASTQLRNWFGVMQPEWKLVFGGYVAFEGEPGREVLQRMANLREIDISGNQRINTLAPVAALSQLEVLRCDNTAIESLQPLSGLEKLRELSFVGTQVSDLEPLRELRQLQSIKGRFTEVEELQSLDRLDQLQYLDLSYTLLSDLTPLSTLKSLKVVKCEHSRIGEAEALKLLFARPGTLIIFRTKFLEKWWFGLDLVWREVFKEHVDFVDVPNSEELHIMTSLNKIVIKGRSGISSLQPLDACINLRYLHLSYTAVSDLSPLSMHDVLSKLEIPNNPVSDLTPLHQLDSLTYFDCSNTPVSDLTPLSSLTHLRALVCAGTQVKQLKPLAELPSLEILDFSNTKVASLKPLERLPNLQILKCFNTKLTSSKVEKFKQGHKGVVVTHY